MLEGRARKRWVKRGQNTIDAKGAMKDLSPPQREEEYISPQPGHGAGDTFSGGGGIEKPPEDYSYMSGGREGGGSEILPIMRWA